MDGRSGTKQGREQGKASGVLAALVLGPGYVDMVYANLHIQDPSWSHGDAGQLQ